MLGMSTGSTELLLRVGISLLPARPGWWCCRQAARPLPRILPGIPRLRSTALPGLGLLSADLRTPVRSSYIPLQGWGNSPERLGDMA